RQIVARTLRRRCVQHGEGRGRPPRRATQGTRERDGRTSAQRLICFGPRLVQPMGRDTKHSANGKGETTMTTERVTPLRLGKGDKRNEWCELQVELRETPKGPELSICGAAGYVVTYAQAKREALAFWESYFDEERGAIQEMNKRCGKRFTSARGAARYLLE